MQVPPALPVKQRLQQGRRSAEMRTASTYDNVNCDFPDTDAVDSHDIRYKVRKNVFIYFFFFFFNDFYQDALGTHYFCIFLVT